MKNYIKVTVFEEEQYEGQWIPRGILDFKKWVDEKIAEIPEKHRESATIEIDSNSSYEGSSYANIEIFYYREESKEEELERDLIAKESREAVKRKELKQLAELKKKYT